MNISRSELVKALQVGVLTGMQIRENQVRQSLYLIRREIRALGPESLRELSQQYVEHAKRAQEQSRLATKHHQEVLAKANGNGFHWGEAS